IRHLDRNMPGQSRSQSCGGAKLWLAHKGLVEIGREVHSLIDALVPQAVCLPDQKADFFGPEFGPGLTEAEHRIGRDSRAPAAVAAQQGRERDARKRAASTHASSAEPCGESGVASLNVCRASRKGNRLHGRRVGLIAAVEVVVRIDVGKAVESYLGLRAGDTQR